MRLSYVFLKYFTEPRHLYYTHSSVMAPNYYSQVITISVTDLCHKRRQQLLKNHNYDVTIITFGIKLLFNNEIIKILLENVFRARNITPLMM